MEFAQMEGTNEMDGTTGWDDSRLVDPTKVDEDLRCPICSSLCRDAVHCLSQHAFCDECIHKWLARRETCPLDNNLLLEHQLAPARLFRQLVNKYQVRCRFAPDGCNEVQCIETIEAHERACGYNLEYRSVLVVPTTNTTAVAGFATRLYRRMHITRLGVTRMFLWVICLVYVMLIGYASNEPVPTRLATWAYVACGYGLIETILVGLIAAYYAGMEEHEEGYEGATTSLSGALGMTVTPLAIWGIYEHARGVPFVHPYTGILSYVVLVIDIIKGPVVIIYYFFRI